MRILERKQIVVVGGAGGLGSAVTELLEAEGVEVIVGYRTRAPQGGGVCADLRRAEDRDRLLDSAPELYGLVVMAGHPARVGNATELEAAMRCSWESNYLGPVLLARDAAARMRSRGAEGAIVLISSMQAVAVFENSTAYAGAKAALINAARILAKECRGDANIRVNVVAPGVIDAGMAQASIAAGKYVLYFQQGNIPRYGAAADVARAVRFFLEPDNYVTGQVLTVDGGLTL
ncbi:MAG TPA: SDR family oxidoreductase [Bryobacteraceae bacterium]|nr:SDR family oxidoreductase [Bryobacteraceae bacterium]